jgi:hypothetical protein
MGKAANSDAPITTSHVSLPSQKGAIVVLFGVAENEARRDHMLAYLTPFTLARRQ